MADIFREVDEDLRRDRIEKLWRRYGGYALGGAVLIIAAAGGFSAWQSWQNDQATQLGERYAEAAGAGDPAKAVPALEVLADQGASGYRLLARFQAAAAKATSGDRPGGIAALKAIAGDSRVDPPCRDLATVLAARYAVDTAPLAEITAALQPLTIAPNPWRFSAAELIGLAQIKAGDVPAATKTYQQLADDLDAPRSLRARAAEILGTLRHQG